MDQIDYEGARGKPPRKHHAGLLSIALFKFLKVAFTCAGGVAALNLLHRDLAQMVHHLLKLFGFAPESHFATWLLAQALNLDDKRLRLIAAGFFLYSTLYTIEGIGLYFEKRWAEWLTVFTSSLLVPLEMRHFYVHPSIFSGTLLGLNLAIIVYLASLLRHETPANPPESATAHSGSPPARHPAPAPLQ